MRWVVIIAALLVFVRGAKAANSTTRLFTIALDIQFLLGLILYVVLSPITRLALQDMGAAMRNSALRFWAVEHAVGMIAALVLAHIGRVRMRRLPDADSRYKTGAMFVGIALVLILISIPWPGMPAARPLFRFR
jgi:hypothetical protein